MYYTDPLVSDCKLCIGRVNPVIRILKVTRNLCKKIFFSEINSISERGLTNYDQWYWNYSTLHIYLTSVRYYTLMPICKMLINIDKFCYVSCWVLILMLLSRYIGFFYYNPNINTVIWQLIQQLVSSIRSNLVIFTLTLV